MVNYFAITSQRNYHRSQTVLVSDSEKYNIQYISNVQQKYTPL